MVGERIPDPVPWEERLRSAPNTVGLALCLAIFVVAVLVGTVPFEVVSESGPVACSSPLFELVVPGAEGPVPDEPSCRDEARTRLALCVVGVVVAVVGGVATRQIRRRRYDPRRYEIEEVGRDG